MNYKALCCRPSVFMARMSVNTDAYAGLSLSCPPVLLWFSDSVQASLLPLEVHRAQSLATQLVCAGYGFGCMETAYFITHGIETMPRCLGFSRWSINCRREWVGTRRIWSGVQSSSCGKYGISLNFLSSILRIYKSFTFDFIVYLYF